MKKIRDPIERFLNDEDDEAIEVDEQSDHPVHEPFVKEKKLKKIKDILKE